MPIGDTGLFTRSGDEFLSTQKELEFPELEGKVEEGAITTIRDWLSRKFGPATVGIQFVCVKFTSFTSKSGGILAVRQHYRGIDTPGSASFELTPARFTQIVYVHLYELSPTRDAPARVISATEASDRANQFLRETPSAMTKRREGDGPALQYTFVPGQSSLNKAGRDRDDDSARWDLIWGFRLPSETFSREPFVNARTGEATVGVCGTGEPDPVVPIERK